MPGQYIYPLTSYFTGGTVSGETVFLAGVTANTLSTENFFISGITLDQAIQQLIDYSAFSGGTISGDTYFASGLSAGTFSVEGDITPFNDNVSKLGIPTNRWSELHVVDGSAVNFTAATLYSGSTLLDSLFARTIHSHEIADVNGLQIYLDSKADLTGATFSGGVFASELSATTLYSGSTLLETAINSIVANTTLHGDFLSLSGGTVTGDTNFSTNLSATTLYSGSTLVDSLFARTAHNHVISDVTGLQAQLNNKADLTGATFIGGIFTPNISATTLYSGTTLLDLLFARTVHSHVISDVNGLQNILNSKSDLSGSTFTGGIFTPTISAATLYSGSTLLETIISTIISSSTINGSYLSLSGGTVSGNTLFSANLSAVTLYSGATLVDSLFARTVHSHVINDVTGLQGQLNGKADLTGATFGGIISSPGFIDSTLTNNRVVYAGPSGRLVDSSAFTFNVGTLFAPNITASGSLLVGTGGAIIGSSGIGDLVVHGNLTVYGQAISAYTANLYIEDNNITLNYNPTGSSTSASLGAGFTIQDGSGIQGTDVLFDIRGASSGLSNRSWSTNIEDIRIRETGTVSAPNGKRLLAEEDVLDGGTF